MTTNTLAMPSIRSGFPPGASAKEGALKDALRFVQAHLGPILRPGTPPGPEQGLITLTGTYPKKTKAMDGKPNRLGANGFASLLVDSNERVLIDAFSTAFAAEVSARGATVAASVAGLSLGRAVFQWAVDARRTFPFLAALPTKAGMANENSLALSASPDFCRVCGPGLIVEFSAPYVRQVRDQLLERSVPAKKWRDACARRARPIVLNGTFHSESVKAYNEKVLEDIKILGEQLLADLPEPGSGDYAALSALFIQSEPLTW